MGASIRLSRRRWGGVAALAGCVLLCAPDAWAQGGQFQRRQGVVAAPEPQDDEFTRDVTRPLNRAYDSYQALERRILGPLGATFDMQASYFTQWGSPRGGRPTSLFVYSPVLTWTPLHSATFGTGTITLGVQGAQFWSGTTASDQQGALGLLSPQNDWNIRAFYWEMLAYTHRFAAPFSWFAVTAGQFGIAGFDGDFFAGNAQTNFVSYALAQNATATYPVAGLGSYATINVEDAALSFSGGFQGATDLYGGSITSAGFSQGRYATFANALWAPRLPGMGQGSYNILTYDMPGVAGQPLRSRGVSFAMSQTLLPGFGVFARAATATGNAVPIETSVAAGAVFANPFRRNSRDQLGIGVFANRASAIAALPPGARRVEWGSEVTYNFIVARGLAISPAMAFFANPLYAPGTGMAGVFTLRTTLFF